MEEEEQEAEVGKVVAAAAAVDVALVVAVRGGDSA
jgi:hypothetical protein